MTAVWAILAKVPLWAWILIAALIVIGWQRVEVIHYKLKAVALQGVANTLHDANQANIATITNLKAETERWADKCAANQPKATAAAEESVKHDASQKNTVDASVKKLHAEAKDDTSVKDWADVPVPDSVVRVLTKNSGAN